MQIPMHARRPARRSVALSIVLCIVLAGFACADEPSEPSEPLVNPADPRSEALERLPPPPADVICNAGLTLADLEATALTGNPTVARAYAMVGAARGDWLQSGLRPNPNVGYEGQQLGSGGLAEQHGVAFGQEITTGGKLRLNRAVSDRRVLIAEQEYAAQRQRVLTDVRVGYYQVLIAQRQVALADELIYVSGEGSAAVASLFKAREVGRVDVLQAQLEAEQARILQQTARNRYESAWRSLTAVVGHPTLDQQTLLGDPDSPAREMEFDRALSRLQSSSPEVSAAVAEVERARFALDRARAQRIPNINFQGLVNWQDNGIGGGADGGVAITLPIPIFDRNQGAIARAEREVVAASHGVSQVTLDLQQRLAPVFETYATSQNQVARYRESILPAAEESLTLTRKMYQAGESNYLGLLTAQRTFAQTNSNYLDALLRLRTAEAEIEGLLLSGSLRSGTAPASVGMEPTSGQTSVSPSTLLGR